MTLQQYQNHALSEVFYKKERKTNGHAIREYELETSSTP